MIPVTTFAGRTVAVFGLGASGLATVRALIAGGATVLAWDDNAKSREAAAAQGLELCDLAATDWSGLAALVLAPGVPLTHPVPHWTVARATAASIEVVGDTDLFFRERAKAQSPALVAAITGTNGKSTTTALTAHLLTAAGFDVQMGGNIGTPVLSLAPFGPGRVYVLELSSFQLDLTPSIACDAAALMNITPDHLDRHGTFEHYAVVKTKIFSGMGVGTTCVLGQGDAPTRAIAERQRALPGLTYRISLPGEPPGDVRAEAGRITDVTTGRVLADVSAVTSLRGAHNWQNAMAAFLLARAITAKARCCSEMDCENDLRAGLTSFPGLAHRMEELGRVGRILYVNDSKATNADSTEKALLSWSEGLFVILGGKPKEGGIEPLRPLFPRIARAYLIGEAAAQFAATLGDAVPYEMCGSLDVALAHASVAAAQSSFAEPVVLLSPACASYDQFRNFEIRGDAFRNLVAALPGFVARGSRT